MGFGRPSVPLGPTARAALFVHHWPGNVRELRNLIERAVMQAQGDEIEAGDLDLTSALDDDHPPLRLEDVEKRHIAEVLRGVGAARTRAAELLGISRSTPW